MYVYVHICVDVCIWVIVAYMCVTVEVRSKHCVSSSISLHFSLEAGFPLNLEIINSAGLAGQCVSQIYLSATPTLSQS